MSGSARACPPWAISMVAGFGCTVAVTMLLAALHGGAGAEFDFAAFVVLTLALGWWSGLAGGLTTAACGWLFWNGFIAEGAAELAWHGAADLRRLLLLGSAALLATALRRLVDRVRVNAFLRASRHHNDLRP